MKISIVIPNYNYGRYIKRTIDSVLSQDYPDKEVVVVDGGSTDETVEVLKGYGDKIRWISEKDRGQWDAINKGLHMVDGEIFAYINSDDWYEPNVFEKIVTIFSAHKDARLVYGQCRIVFPDRNEVHIPPSHISYQMLLRRGNMTSQPSTFFDRKSLVEAGGIGEYDYMMEYDMNLKVLQNGATYNTNDVLANFLVHQGQKSDQDIKGMEREIMAINKKHGGGYFSPLFLHHIAHQCLPPFVINGVRYLKRKF